MATSSSSSLAKFMEDIEQLANSISDSFHIDDYTVRVESRMSALETKMGDLETSLLPFKTSVLQLEGKVKESEQLEQVLDKELAHYRCNICMAAYKEVAFQCGHAFCDTCAKKLSGEEENRCPICRRVIKEQLKLKFFDN